MSSNASGEVNSNSSVAARIFYTRRVIGNGSARTNFVYSRPSIMDSLTYNYRYRRSGQYYYTSQYGAQMLQNALNYGYEEGFRSGQADREDGWAYDYSSSYAYQDASYGYDGYYVDVGEYSILFPRRVSSWI